MPREITSACIAGPLEIRELLMARFSRTIFVLVALLMVSGAQGALIDRGGGFIYDNVLDITWTQNTKIVGFDFWDNQVSWADSLSLYDSVRDVTYDDWRLPSMDLNADDTIVDCSLATELACRENEYGYIYHQYGVNSVDDGLFTKNS